MEFLFGEELRQALQREKFMPPARLVRMISQVAIGLDKAHARKFVHRDLKPDNVFLCQTPEGDIVKLLDFGSVKDKTEGAKKLTVMGTTIGSPFYMSPEQAQGLETLDQRADVWAMGAILYECLAGKVPFHGVNGPQILLCILTKEPTPISEVEGAKYQIPPGLDGVMDKAFKKTASLRYDSVGGLADAFGRAFGLDGNHNVWATTPEADLGSKIEARIASLMTAPKPVKNKTAQDDFFGDSDSLGEVGGKRDSMAKAMQTVDSEGPEDPPAYIPGAGVPQDGVPVWAYAAGALLLLTLVWLLFF
jgi:serine/threonine-protein kinase